MFDNDVILAEQQVSLPDNLNEKKKQTSNILRGTRETGRWGSKLWSVKFHHAGTSLKCTPIP